MLSPPRNRASHNMDLHGLSWNVTDRAYENRTLNRAPPRASRKDPGSRPAWVVPALNLVGFTAMPRLVASSVWEPERRLIGPRTLRVNYLKTLLALLRKLTILERADPQAESALAAMVYRY